VELRKFSTMGSACTFPVESLLFLSVCLAAVLVSRRWKINVRSITRLAGEVAVYGDDLIVPADSRELVVRSLEALGLKINTDKSYWTGMFRESCGVDSYAGTKLTPAYWRSSNTGRPESIVSLVEVANNFRKRWLQHTSAYLASTIPTEIPRVGMHSGVCGLKSFSKPSNHHLKKRWNGDLQRDESLVLCLISKAKKTPITDDSALFQYFTEAPLPTTLWVGGVAKRPRLRLQPRWVPNEDLA
jgi:hypothetical protein